MANHFYLGNTELFKGHNVIQFTTLQLTEEVKTSNVNLLNRRQFCILDSSPIHSLLNTESRPEA